MKIIIITRKDGYCITRTGSVWHIRKEADMSIVGWAVNQSQALLVLNDVAYRD